MGSKEFETAPRWMFWVLTLAGAYNILWGTVVILFPNLLFDLFGMVRPLYPSSWQCIGMVIGVYGVGYAIAARDPVRHWPIVLVGFLGKLFGPIGVLWTAWNGELPWNFFWLNVTNDLVWLPAFTAILWHAYREHDWSRVSVDERDWQTRLEATPVDSQHSLWSASFERPALVVLLRHMGCTYCREAIADLSALRDSLTTAGVRLVLVHQGDDAAGRFYAETSGLTWATWISDRERKLYRAFELKLGTFAQLFGPKVVWRAIGEQALLRHGVGKLEGNGFQMGGAFLVRDGRIVAGEPAKTAADRPNYVGIVESGERSPLGRG